MLQHPQVISFIQSLHAYKDLLSWEMKYQYKGRGHALYAFLHAIRSGNLEWYIMLIKCVKHVVKSVGSEESDKMSFVVPHLFFNDKNTEEGRINLQQILRELAAEISQFIKHHLFRHSNPEKLKQDIMQYNSMLSEISQPIPTEPLSPAMKRKP